MQRNIPPFDRARRWNVPLIPAVSLLGTTSGRWSDSHDHSINWTYTLQSDGSWKLTGGSGSYKGNNSTSWSRQGSGSYERGQVAGELSESRTLSSGDSYDLSLSVADGQWQKTGSGEGYWSEERDSTDESDRPYASSDGRIEGNVHIKDYQGTQQTAQWSQQLNSEGAWVLGDGSAENRAISERDWSYQGQGEYTHQSYSGTIQENASGHWSESRTIDYTLVEGQWILESSRGEGSSSGMGVYSDSGQGAYSYTIQGKMVDLGGTWGSASGLMNESISESWTENRSWSLQLEEDGSWVLADGTGQLEGRRDRQQDYQAQGQYPVAGGYEGHLHEEGHESFTNDYQFSDSVVEGAWVRTGSSERELKGESWQ